MGFTVQEDIILLNELKQKWNNSTLINDKLKTDFVLEILYNIASNKLAMLYNIKMLLKGNSLQLKTWEALCRISYGKTASYSDIAKQIKSTAVRAVATAIASNHIAYFIPCHRVIRKTGEISKYK